MVTRSLFHAVIALIIFLGLDAVTFDGYYFQQSLNVMVTTGHAAADFIGSGIRTALAGF